MKAKADSKSLEFKLHYLLEHVVDPETGELMSIPQLAKKMEHVGFPAHANTLRNLLSGANTNPSWYIIEGIAAAFGISPDLFRRDVTTEEWTRQQLQRQLLGQWESLVERGERRDGSPVSLGTAERWMGILHNPGSPTPEGVELATDVATLVLQFFAARNSADFARSSTSRRRRASDRAASPSTWSGNTATESDNVEEDTGVQRAVAK